MYKAIFTFLCFFVIGVMPCNAHPHVFVDAKTSLVTEDGKLSAINQEWRFDEMFSETVLSENDNNGNEKLDADELKNLEHTAFVYLENYNFFTHLSVGDNDIELNKYSNFNARYENGILIYNFSLPVLSKPDLDDKVTIGVFDPEYYVGITYNDNEPLIINGSKCAFDLREDKANPIYAGLVNPLKFFINCGEGAVNNVSATGMWHKILQTQTILNSKLSVYIKLLQGENKITALFWVLLLGFVYGVVHAIGPGHGKAVVTSYFLSQDKKWRDGVIMGFEIGLSHVTSAIIFVYCTNMIIQGVTSDRSQEMHLVKMVSFSLIAIIGLVMLVMNIKNSHKEDCHCHNHKGQGFIAVIVGSIPCSGAMLILLYAMAKDVLWAGVVATVALGLGIATTLSLVGVATVMLKKRMERTEETMLKTHKLSLFMRYASSFLILFLGSFFLFGEISRYYGV